MITPIKTENPSITDFSIVFITSLHLTDDIPPSHWWYPSIVLNTLNSTENISHRIRAQDIFAVLMISLCCIEYPLPYYTPSLYCTCITQDGNEGQRWGFGEGDMGKCVGNVWFLFKWRFVCRLAAINGQWNLIINSINLFSLAQISIKWVLLIFLFISIQ